MIDFLHLRGFLPLIITLFYVLPLIRKPTYSSIQPVEENLDKAIALYGKIIDRSIRRRAAFVILSFVGILGELGLIGFEIFQISKSEKVSIADNSLFWILAAYGIMWGLYLITTMSVLPSVVSGDRSMKYYSELTDERLSSLKFFEAEYSSLYYAILLLMADYLHSNIISHEYRFNQIGWKLVTARLVLSVFLLTFFAYSFSESRFLKRLLLMDNSSKEPTASWFSQLTFSYADDLIAIGAEKALDYEDLDGLIPGDKSKPLIEKFNKVKKDEHSLMRNIFRLVKTEFLLQQLATFIGSWSIIAGPILLKLTLDYLADPSTVSHPAMPYIYALLMFFVTMIRSFADGQTYFLGRRIGLRVKTVLISLIYTKSLRRIATKTKVLSEMSAEHSNPGKITNLMSVDAQKILDVCCYLMYLWSTPLQTLICVVFLIYIAGIPGLAGVLVMGLSIPLAAKVMSALQKLRKKLMNSTDLRINAVNELLQSIRIVKFFAWENRFLEKLARLRENELQDLWNYVFSQAFYRIIWTATPVLVSFFTFLTFSVFSDRELTISTAFTCLALFDQLRRPLLIIPDIVVNVLEAWVSYERIRNYIESPELEEYINPTAVSDPNNPALIKFIPESKFTWNSDPESEVDGQHKSFTLSNVGITFPKGGLTIIYGSTGSGKSTLLSAILGELHKLHGGVNLFGGKGKKADIPVAYASQQVWLQNATIKNNILFGNPYDPQRYNAVIKYCALKRDLQVLEAGDNLEVGEKGVNLSGGQKARISLARALYSKSEIILMDDVLSAVDVPTAKHIFDLAICGPLMKGRTKVLVTHAVDLCAPKADLIVQMKRGRPEIIELHKLELFKGGITAEAKRNGDNGTHGKAESAHVENHASHQLIEAENRAEGSVKLDVYLCYLKACGGPLFVLFLLFTFGIAQALIVGNDFWVKIWTDQYAKQIDVGSYFISFISTSLVRSSPKVDLFYYIGIYALIGGLSIMLVLGRILLVASASMKASRTLHASLTFKILRAPVKFFEKTPMGRILNRFSKDMKDIDLEVAQFSSDFLANLVRTISFLLIVMFITPTSMLGVLPIFIIFVVIDIRYLRAQRELKRMDSNSRSPIFSHFGEALSGASTIRAYAVEESFVDELHKKVDLNNQAFSLIWILNRWLGVRIDMIGAIVGFSTMMSVICVQQFVGGIDAGYAALSITYSLGVSECLVWLVRMHALMEMEMNAVERVDEYLRLDEEPPAIIEDYRPPPNWPNAGVINVEKLNLRYNADGPKILSDVTFSTKPGEKIGIVGRTGAGKTTLSLAFFRFLEPESGTIRIDGVNICKLGVQDLRSRLTVIPQDPVLFSGTLRSNLDPFSEYSDHDIWTSLKHCHFLESCMLDNSSSSDLLSNNHNITLDSAVEEGGTNFSQGQRQLLCLGRAILKQSKLIILDEATASIDHETDAKIQQTIRDQFKGSTLLVIAHRLSTIMDYDRIMVLDKGKLSQYDSPKNLIAQQGIFREMCIESSEFDKLEKIANGNLLIH